MQTAMGKTKSWNPNYDSPSEPALNDNAFLQGLMDHMNSPEGSLYMEVSDTLRPVLDKMHVDAKKRQIIWQDGTRLDLDESVKQFLVDYPEFPSEKIESCLISWIESGYVPENYTTKQFEQLDQLTEEWLKDHYRRTGNW